MLLSTEDRVSEVNADTIKSLFDEFETGDEVEFTASSPVLFIGVTTLLPTLRLSAKIFKEAVTFWILTVASDFATLGARLGITE